MQPRLSGVLTNPNVIPFCLSPLSVKTLAFTLYLFKTAQGAVMLYFIPLAFNAMLAKNRRISYCIKSSIMACDWIFNEGGSVWLHCQWDAASHFVMQSCFHEIKFWVTHRIHSNIVIVYLHCTKQYLRLPNHIANNVDNSTWCWEWAIDFRKSLKNIHCVKT